MRAVLAKRATYEKNTSARRRKKLSASLISADTLNHIMVCQPPPRACRVGCDERSRERSPEHNTRLLLRPEVHTHQRWWKQTGDWPGQACCLEPALCILITAPAPARLAHWSHTNMRSDIHCTRGKERRTTSQTFVSVRTRHVKPVRLSFFPTHGMVHRTPA